MPFFMTVLIGTAILMIKLLLPGLSLIKRIGTRYKTNKLQEIPDNSLARQNSNMLMLLNGGI